MANGKDCWDARNAEAAGVPKAEHGLRHNEADILASLYIMHAVFLGLDVPDRAWCETLQLMMDRPLGMVLGVARRMRASSSAINRNEVPRE